jgi:peptidoglycan/xylan/chitin deacetylase (PgdA/CDA1 family)
MKKIKRIFRVIFLYCGPWMLLKCYKRWRVGSGITILYGHRVLPDEVIANPDDPCTVTGHTSVTEVEIAIQELSKRFSIISIGDAVKQVKNCSVKKESIVLTFDDGFRDNFKYLYPVLKKHNIPATFYVNPSVINTDKNLWFQAVINYFFAVPTDRIFIEHNQKEYQLLNASQRYQAAFDFMQYLQSKEKPQDFLKIIYSIAGDLCKPKQQDFHMSWDELQILANDPLITIGAHSFNHYPLGYCDEQLAEYEIAQSISVLEERLSIKIEHFSFPRGHKEDMTDHHSRYLASLGMLSAVSTIRGVNRQKDDLFCLKRVGFPQNVSDDIEDFLWHVAGIPQIIQNHVNFR